MSCVEQTDDDWIFGLGQNEVDNYFKLLDKSFMSHIEQLDELRTLCDEQRDEFNKKIDVFKEEMKLRTITTENNKKRLKDNLAKRKIIQ